jgi:ribose 5-phosphate isomerase B
MRKGDGDMLAIGCDHAGYPLKVQLIKFLQGKGIELYDVGCFSTDSVDYPAYADAVANEVLQGRSDRGVLVCGTGIGMSIAANRHKGIRCALCSDTYTARMTRAHNDANVLALGARVVGVGLAEDILDIFLSTPYEGGRHARRVEMLDR